MGRVPGASGASDDQRDKDVSKDEVKVGGTGDPGAWARNQVPCGARRATTDSQADESLRASMSPSFGSLSLCLCLSLSPPRAI